MNMNMNMNTNIGKFVGGKYRKYRKSHKKMSPFFLFYGFFHDA